MKRVVLALALALAVGACPARPVKHSRATSVGPFSATLTWTPAANGMDGGTLGTITGFYIKYDTVSRKGGGVYANRFFVSGGSATTGTVTGLFAGTYYFAIVPYDGTNEGAADMEWSKTQ